MRRRATQARTERPAHRARVRREPVANLKLASKAAFAVLVLAVVGLFLRHSFLAGGPVTITAQVLAVLVMLWARVTFGRRSFHAAADPTAGGLVTTGPYRFLRHPIYAALLLFLAAGLVSHLSVVNATLAAAAAGAVAVRIVAEERLLVLRYPEYAAYAARTKRVVPFVL